MITRILFLIILLPLAFHVKAQTLLNGKVISTNGDLIPKVTLSVSTVGAVSVFHKIDDTETDNDGTFSIKFPGQGVYHITVRSVFHETMRIPVLIFDQQELNMNIYPLPRHYSDGKYFHLDEHLEWVRLYGNFNEYSYSKGQKFSLNDDGTISAFIPVIDDTIRYQVRTVTGGAAPLPTADFYELREDGTFESVIVLDSSTSDSLEIIYDPENPIPYKRFLPDKRSPGSIPIKGFLSFSPEADSNWVSPLLKMERIPQPVIFNSEFTPPFESKLLKKVQDSSGFRFDGADTHKEIRTQIRSIVELNELHPQQRNAYYIAYAKQLFMENASLRFVNRHLSEAEKREVFTEPEFLLQITENAYPDHPLWATIPQAPVLMLELSGNHPRIVRFLEEMVKNHSNDLIVRYAAIELISLKAANYTDITEMPYFHWIVDRYGDRHLAALARRTFNKLN